jgi:hypothetical protein
MEVSGANRPDLRKPAGSTWVPPHPGPGHPWRWMMLFKCYKCHQLLPRESFSKNRAKSRGIQPECKACRQELYYAWYRTHKGRDWKRDYVRRRAAEEGWPKRPGIKRDPLKVSCRRQLRSALKSGAIRKPANCSQCGREARITAHHADYRAPLAVEWLCYECHGLRHRVKVTR